MIAAPLNDLECLSQLTAIAAEGAGKPEVKELAARFRTTGALATWIRSLPQRDDTGDASDGPRVACDVMQRARLVATDPNCVERAILYLAVAEVMDPATVRQLATVDVSESLRHTFPVEGGEPVVLDPEVRRNALRAGVWALRNGGAVAAGDLGDVDAPALVEWLMDLAEDEAEERMGASGVLRVERARGALSRLLGRRPVTPRDRADVLHALRLAGDVAGWFGAAGAEGFRVARALIARLLVRGTVGAGRARNVNLERAVYWGGKAVATVYGVGGLYDAAYDEVRRRPGAQPRAPPKVPARTEVVPRTERRVASAAVVLGTLDELDRKGG